MPSTFDKLNLKLQRVIVVINAPASFEPELAALKDVVVLRDAKKAKAVHFAIAFATKQDEVDVLSKALAARAEGDALLWFAYPKGTSKRYKCEFNRDTGWDVLRGAGFDTVRGAPSTKTGQRCGFGGWSLLRWRGSGASRALSRSYSEG